MTGPISTSDEISRLIRLAPPLPVMIHDHLCGQLIALNTEHMVIEWANTVAEDTSAKNILPVTINLTNGKRIDLNALSAKKSLVPADEKSSKTLIDLVHQIRKEQHIHICANEDVEATHRGNGFQSVQLPHVALPELNWSDIDTRRTFLGRSFGAPILITGMTGGIEKAAMINERLAHAAVKFNIPMGVGSQRLAIENPAHANIFRLKARFPELFLIANVGIAQILQNDWDHLCTQAVEMIQADALAIHVNVLQELVQVEGDRNFRGAIKRIGEIVARLQVPVMVKEVGAGLDARSIRALAAVGVKTFDIGGRGGTSWAWIEGRRSLSADIQRLGRTFRDWGITTADALKQAQELNLPHCEFVATGGIRDGVTVLKAIYCGATMAGIGLPLFRAALQDEYGPARELEQIMSELKIAMMCGGTATLTSAKL